MNIHDACEEAFKRGYERAVKEFIDIAKFKFEEPWLYSKKAICRTLDEIAKEMGVEL